LNLGLVEGHIESHPHGQRGVLFLRGIAPAAAAATERAIELLEKLVRAATHLAEDVGHVVAVAADETLLAVLHVVHAALAEAAAHAGAESAHAHSLAHAHPHAGVHPHARVHSHAHTHTHSIAETVHAAHHAAAAKAAAKRHTARRAAATLGPGGSCGNRQQEGNGEEEQEADHCKGLRKTEVGERTSGSADRRCAGFHYSVEWGQDLNPGGESGLRQIGGPRHAMEPK